MKRKFTMTLLLLALSLCVGILLAGCGGNNQVGQEAETGAKTEAGAKTEMVTEEEPLETEFVPTAFSVDWDRCIEEAEEELRMGYVKDLDISVNEDNRDITLIAVIDADLPPEVALDYADTLLSGFNMIASNYDSTIKVSSEETYGGLYDLYGVTVGVAPAGKEEIKEEWFVNQKIEAGTKTKQQLKLQSR